MYPFHQNILLRPHFPYYCFIVLFFFSLKWLKELSNAILWFPTYVQDRILSQTLRSKLFWQFWQKKKYRKNRKYSKKITNSTRIANFSKTLLQIFVAILAKICLIEIACRNLVFKSAKIAKVTRNFIAPKKHPDNYRKYMRV